MAIHELVQLVLEYHFYTYYQLLFTSHCLDLDLNGKRPVATSEGNFSSYLIVRSYSADTTISGHFLWTEMEGCTNRAWPIQPIGRFLVKLPKWHFLTNEWNLNFLGQMTSFEVVKDSS